MVNSNKVIISIFVIMMITCLDIKYSCSQEKPSEKVIKDIIILLEKDSKLLPIYIKNVKYNAFDIIKEFISPQNGRYCVEVNFDISVEGRKSTLADFKEMNVRVINKKYSFVKKYNQWYGYRGWGSEDD